MVKLTGKMIEIGNLELSGGRGMRLESAGEIIEITGMTEDECREICPAFGEFVTITIESSNAPLTGAATGGKDEQRRQTASR